MAFDANDLSPHEQFVVARTEAGEVADFSPMAGPDGTQPIVRAGFLRKLMLQIEPAWPVRATGVRLRGARIEGALDLSDCTGAGGAGLPALALERCTIPEPIELSRSRLARLSLHGSTLCALLGEAVRLDNGLDASSTRPPEGGAGAFTANLRAARIYGDAVFSNAKLARVLDADTPMRSAGRSTLMLDGAQIEGGLWLDSGFEALGCVSLVGAQVSGVLDCEAGAFLNREESGDGVAIAGDYAWIHGAWTMREGARIEGEARFKGARIGAVEINNASFRNEGATALHLRNCEITGECKLTCRIAGALVLAGAHIGRNLDLRGSEIAHPLNPRGDQFGCALDATDTRVGGALLLQAASIKGECLLAAARIEGYLAFGGGRFLNPGAYAIRAPNVVVGGNLSLKMSEGDQAPFGQKTVVEGGAKFDRANVSGSLAWSNLELRGAAPGRTRGALLSFADARIAGALDARALTAGQDCLIDLSGAECAALSDDLKTGWGAESARLNLDGFRYGRLDQGDGSERWRARLAWLRRGRTRDFSPQPYGMLAQVYSDAGQREDARRILLEQHDARTRSTSSGPFTWGLSSLFGLIAGYGLAPVRIARALALYLAIGVAGVFAMDMQGALIRPNGHVCGGAIEPALYAIDVAVPVLDLRQQQACAPGRAARADLPSGIALPDTDWRLFEGVALWRWAQALYALFGAILTGLAILTFSGVMKPKKQD